MTGPSGAAEARKRQSSAVSPTIGLGVLSKRVKRGSGLVIADALVWPPLDTLWETIGDRASEAFVKKQGTLEEYDAAVKVFLGRLSLLVCGLHQDQLMVVFRATIPNWYSTAEKNDKMAMTESFETAQT